MSMYADLISQFRKAKDNYNMTEEDATKLFLGVLGCLEWDLDDSLAVDYQMDYWQEQEQKLARNVLFPKSKANS